MIAHKPSDLPLAGNVRFTEDTVEMKLGESPLWRNASRLRPYRLDILDVRQAVAASQAIVEESGAPVMLMLRLKITGGKIAEVETQVTRSKAEGSLFNIDALKSPSGAMLLFPEPSGRASREDMHQDRRVVPSRAEGRQFRHGGHAFRPRRVPFREWATDGRAELHVSTGLREHQNAEDSHALRGHNSGCGGGRRPGYRTSSHGLWRRVHARCGRLAGGLGSLQSLRRPDSCGGSVHEEYARWDTLRLGPPWRPLIGYLARQPFRAMLNLSNLPAKSCGFTRHTELEGL